MSHLSNNSLEACSHTEDAMSKRPESIYFIVSFHFVLIKNEIHVDGKRDLMSYKIQS